MTDYELSLQRLVDDELSAERRHALLARAEAEPGLWREIALAFIESRRLRREFCVLFEADEETVLSNNVAVSRFGKRTWALAAGLLLMLALGFLAGGQFAAMAPKELSETSRDAKAMPSGGALRTNGFSSNEAPFRLLVRTPSADGDDSVIDLPAYDEASLRKRSSTPEAVNGWAVNWHPNLLTGKLEDGRRVYVPVSLPNISYQGQ